MSTPNQLDLETLGSRPITMSKIFMDFVNNRLLLREIAFIRLLSGYRKEVRYESFYVNNEERQRFYGRRIINKRMDSVI